MEQHITLAIKNWNGNLNAFKTTKINATTMKNIAIARQMYALCSAEKMKKKFPK